VGCFRLYCTTVVLALTANSVSACSKERQLAAAPSSSSSSSNTSRTDSQPGSELSSSSGDSRPLSRVLHIELEIVPVEDHSMNRVALVFTDETGASHHELIGEFAGDCKDTTVSTQEEPMKPLLGIGCWNEDDSGTTLRFVHRRDNLYVLIAPLKSRNQQPEFEPQRTIALPTGTRIQTNH